jgi:biopolymer transport protein ExbD
MTRFTGKAHRRVPAPGMSLAAMVDIVTLLLMFFICTNQWGVPEGALPADLPSGSGRETPVPREPRDIGFLRIQITGVGDDVQIRFQERPVAGIPGLSQALNALAGIDRTVPVIIDAKGTVAFRWVIRSLNACLKADLENVSFTAPAEGVGR